MEERFPDSQAEQTTLGQMRELRDKDDIDDYLMDMETLNYKVCLVGTPWMTLLRDVLSEDLQSRLSTTIKQPRNDIDYV